MKLIEGTFRILGGIITLACSALVILFAVLSIGIYLLLFGGLLLIAGFLIALVSIL